MQPGVYPASALSNEDYHASAGISKSGLDAINRSPAHYWARYMDPQRKPEEPTQAMRDGTALHCAILEPEEFGARYIVLDGHPELEGTLRTADDYRAACEAHGIKPARSMADNRARLVEAQAPVRFYDVVLEALTHGRTPLTQEQRDTYMRIRDAVHAHPGAGYLLERGNAETSAYATDPETGLLVKCRPDWISDNIMVDLKSTEDARPSEFARSAWNWRYHVAGAFYPHVWQLATGVAPDDFVFIAFEKKPPFAVCVYVMDKAMRQRGVADYTRNLKTYAACAANDNWPAYGDDVQVLGLPSWVKPDASDY